MAPHHGSATSSSLELIAATRAGHVIAQAGMLNRFRHPAPAVEHRWTAAACASGAATGMARWWRNPCLPNCGCVERDSATGATGRDAEAGATCRAMSGATCWATWATWGEGEASAGKRRSKARARPRAQLAVSISSTGTCAKLAGFICLCFKHYSDNVHEPDSWPRPRRVFLWRVAPACVGSASPALPQGCGGVGLGVARMLRRTWRNRRATGCPDKIRLTARPQGRQQPCPLR